MNWLEKLFERHKFVRRATLAWACWLITITVLRVTEPETLPLLTNAVAVAVTAVIGILATVVGFYIWSRDNEDKK